MASPALFATESGRFSSLVDKFVMGGTGLVASTNIKVPPLACCAVGDWLELFVLANPVHFPDSFSIGGMDLMPGHVLVKAVPFDVASPVAMAAFYRT